jgi:ATP/maltotriose-dependent transcriptional regulator MalT/DNA-binding SARP family transcriptional activator
MPGRSPIPAKLSRPRMTAVYPRTRLFERLDACADKPVAWIASPAGAGKTLLTESYLRRKRSRCLWYELDAGDGDPATFFYYLGTAARLAAPRRRVTLPLLTPEYALGVPAFSRRFFEQLGALLRPPSILVFDNYQDAPDDAPLHAILAEAVAALPQGVRMLVLSRGAPAPAFARQRSAGALEVIGWDELRLTEEEAHGIAALRSKGATGRAAAPPGDLLARAQGWAAGLVLLLEQAHDDPASAIPAAEEPAGLVFDYFAHELLRKAEPALQSFLMKTALPPTFSRDLAQRLTGLEDVDRLLSRLLRDNLFTTQLGADPPRYRYHPLFRAFLLQRGREALPAAERVALEGTAAEWLAGDGQYEAAMELLLRREDWRAAAVLIRDHAEELMQQGRFRTLLEWLHAFPEDSLRADPWLRYWLGSGELYVNPTQARDTLRAALDGFKAAGDALGSYLAWARASEICFMEWDNFHPLDEWIEEMQELRTRFPDYPSTSVHWRTVVCMAQSLMMRQPFHPELHRWIEELNRVLHMDPAVVQHLIATYVEFVYFFVRGDVAGMRSIMAALRPLAENGEMPPVVRIFWLVNVSQEAFYNLDSERARNIAEQGLELARQTGVHNRDNCLLDNALKASVALGDVERAEHYLQEMRPFVSATTGFYTSRYYRDSSQIAFFKGDLAAAQEHIANSLTFSDTLGFTFHHIDCQMGQATINTAAGHFVEAQRALRDLSRSARRMANPYLAFLARLGRADLALRRERDGLAVRLLRGALGQGRQAGFRYLEWWNPAWLGRLCALALREGIEPEYVGELIARYRLPPPAQGTPADWPWPLRVRVLGPAVVERQGEPLRFSGKAQQKPLELLKALLALGGQDVAVNHLCELLWPDSDGDDAQRAFGVTLHRLRKLVGNEPLRLSERRLSLDPQQCWVDCWALRERLSAAEQGLAARAEAPALQALQEALALYRGPFLAGEDGLAPYLAERQRLSARLAAATEGCAGLLLSAHREAAAIELARRGLELLPQSEAMYRTLVRAHLGLGQRSDAVRTFRHCMDMLGELGVPPAPETLSLQRAIQA